MSVHHEEIRITSHCPIDLDRSGVGDGDRSLHCEHCVKDVHLLSNMSEKDAREFMRERAGEDIGVSYAIGAGGKIRFAPERSNCASSSRPAFVPVSALRRRVASSSPARALMSMGAAMLLAACAPHSSTSAIKADEETPAPIIDGVVIPDDRPCDPGEEIVEGGIEAVELEPIEKHIAGGLRATPIPDPLPEPIAEEPKSDEPEVHTPPPAPEPEAEVHVRGRVAPKALSTVEG
jgi:hypothetical protein